MAFEVFWNVAAMPADVDAYLAREPLVNNVPLGILERLRRGAIEIRNYQLFVVRDAHNQVIQYGHLMSPHPMCLSLGTGVAELKQALHDRGITYERIQGEKAIVEAFLQAEPTSFPIHVERQGFYKLMKVSAPTATGADYMPADEKDLELLTDWAVAFSRECDLEEGNRDESKAYMLRKIFDQHAFVLKHKGIPVSWVNIGRILPGGATIGPVYTPPEFRRKGFGAELSAKVSQTILDKGNSYCCLFTQLDNATSNKIYQTIGYEWVCEFLMVKVRP